MHASSSKHSDTPGLFDDSCQDRENRDEPTAPGALPDQNPWKMLVVDDEKVLHSLTQEVLSRFEFAGRPLQIINAYSALEARECLQRHPDVHVILLDVVMETDDAGLKLVHYVRKQLANLYVRIILRTGQPEAAPENQVLSEYDINDYREKSDLTEQKLTTAVINALRAYRDLQRIETLTRSNLDLEQRVAERTRELEQSNRLLQAEIEERRQAEAHVRKLASAMEQSADLVLITDRNGIVEYVNRAFEEATGYSRREILGATPALLKSGRQGASFYQAMWKTITSGNVFSEILVNRRKDGSIYYEEKSISPLFDPDHRITHFLSTGKEVTERMQAQARIEHLAHHDELTGLPNRLLYQERLREALGKSRGGCDKVGIMFVDVDHFKPINDNLGHAVGDVLLEQLSRRLQECVRARDLMARIGGDEFAAVIAEVSDEAHLVAVAQRMLKALSESFHIEEHELHVGSSIGISRFPDDGEDTQGLLGKADLAMYRAKKMGGNTYCFYTEEDAAYFSRRMKLENELGRAVEKTDFKLLYQPQLDLASGQVAGMEVLLRWRHNELGNVAPQEFIPLLEERGLMCALGAWVLRNACSQTQTWRKAGLRLPRMAVNLSQRQFYHKDLTRNVRGILDDTCLEPAALVLEVTEGTVTYDMNKSISILSSLHEMGVVLALDDFGMGYSSFNYLKSLPVDVLKIDSSFIEGIPNAPENMSITAGIISLAHNLKLTTLAEGVEHLEQLRFLQEHRCSGIQGFLYSKPLSAKAAALFLQSNMVHPQHLDTNIP